MGFFALLKANLKHRKSSFVSVFILMIIVSCILTSSLSLASNVNSRVLQANDEIGTGDIVVFIGSTQFTDEMRSKLENSEAVDRIRVTDAFFSSDTVVKDTQVDDAVFFTAYDCGDKPYAVFDDTFKAFDDNPAPLRDGEIYLPFGLKKTCPCEKGDRITLTLSEKTVCFTVVGFVEEPFVGCDVIGTKNLLITRNDLDSIISENANVYAESETKAALISPVKQIHMFAADEYKDDIRDFTSAINEETEIIDLAVNSLLREDMQTYTLRLPLLMCGVLFLFLAILMTVVGLVLSNNIGTSIEMEYVNIGILKSQGITKSKIRLVFLLQYLMPAVLGSLVGLLMAFPVVDLIRPLFITVSCVLVSNELSLSVSIAVLFSILELICLFIFAKTARVSKISPIRAISGGLEDIHFSSVLRTTVIGKSKALIGIRLAFRQITSNIKQYVGICVILTFLVFYLSTCNALFKNFTVEFYDEMYGISSADICVDYKEHIDMRADIEKDISDISAINGSYMYGEAELFVDDVPYKMQLLDDMLYLSNFIDGKIPVCNNELVISNFLSRKIGKTIGDYITIKYGDTSRRFIICGRYDSIHFAGSTFALTFEAAHTLNPAIKPDGIYYIVEDKELIDKINETVNEKYNKFGLETINSKRKSEATINTAIDVVKSMILFIFIIATIFSVIVVWMVCTKSFLKERLNIGIYKTYGFSTFSLKLQFCFRYLIVALTACGLGVTLYTFFGDALNLTTFMALGVTQFHAPLTPESYIIPPSLICFFVFLASYVTMGKINRVSTKELVIE